MIKVPPSSLLILAALLTGCTQGPDFAPPAPPTASAYTAEGDTTLSGDQQIAKGQDIPEAWWSLFHLPSLDAVIAEALAGNHTLAAASAHLTQAQEETNALAGSTEPQAALDATGGRQKYGAALFGPTNFQIPPFNYYEIGPSLSTTLDIFGGQRRAVERLQALQHYQAYQFRAARLTLTGNVILQALNIATAHAQIDLVQQIIADDDQNLRLVQTSLAAGSATRNDVVSAQTQAANDRTLLPPLHQQINLARHALAILVGHAPSEWAPPDFTLGQFTLPATLPLTLPSELVRRRPDILAAEAELHAATAAVGMADANLYPHITLTASGTLQSLQPEHLFDLSGAAAAMAASVTQTIFDGGTLHAQQRAAAAALLAQQELYQQTVISAFGQIADSLQALQTDQEAVLMQKAALDSAAQSLDLARQSYRAGNSGVLQILDAQRLHEQALLGSVRAAALRLQDSVQLFLRMGGASEAGRWD